MNKKTILTLIIVVIVVAAGFTLLNKPKPQPDNNLSAIDTKTNQSNPTAPVVADTKTDQPGPSAPVKEFVMQSFVEMADGQPKPQYSLREITVKKGDLVRIKITVTKGSHDFKIDEYNIYADTQLNQEYTVEFIADKVGEFIYYCTKPGHRALGHWGTLKVTE